MGRPPGRCGLTSANALAPHVEATHHELDWPADLALEGGPRGVEQLGAQGGTAPRLGDVLRLRPGGDEHREGDEEDAHGPCSPAPRLWWQASWHGLAEG